MNTALQITLGLILVLQLIIPTYTATACVTDEDCNFMGTCDKVSKTCVCRIDCGVYRPAANEKTSYYCTSQNVWPVTQCKALSVACESNENLIMKIYNTQEFQESGNTCRNIPYEGAEEFCEDQNFCKGNGICYRSIGDPEAKFCRCNRMYTGERCEIRTLAISDDESAEYPDVLAGESDGNQSYSHGSESMLGRIAPYLAFGVLSVVLGCCLVSQYVKRRNDVKGAGDTEASGEPGHVATATGKDDHVITVVGDVKPTNVSSATHSVPYRPNVPLAFVKCQGPTGQFETRVVTRARL